MAEPLEPDEPDEPDQPADSAGPPVPAVDRASAIAIVRSTLGKSELAWEEIGDGLFMVELPGERKLKTPCRLDVGKHSFAIHAFVSRRVDENAERVYRWLLERNLRLFGVSFALDHHGDIYLDGRLPLDAVTEDQVDRLLGSVLTYADDSFNTILELGFGSAIRKEWDWRVSRGESTRNLEAFRGWLERQD